MNLKRANNCHKDASPHPLIDSLLFSRYKIDSDNEEDEKFHIVLLKSWKLEWNETSETDIHTQQQQQQREEMQARLVVKRIFEAERREVKCMTCVKSATRKSLHSVVICAKVKFMQFFFAYKIDFLFLSLLLASPCVQSIFVFLFEIFIATPQLIETKLIAILWISEYRYTIKEILPTHCDVAWYILAKTQSIRQQCLKIFTTFSIRKLCARNPFTHSLVLS